MLSQGNRSSFYEQFGAGLSGAMGEDSIMQVVQHILALQTSRLDDRQDALDEATARLTPTAETALPPQHRQPQQPLDRIVRRLHAIEARERPQRRLQRQHVLTKG